MPRLTRVGLRAALVHLVIGTGLGALLLASKGGGVSGFTWAWLPVHRDLLLVGWFWQMIVAVAFWILPRFRRPPLRGNQVLAWATLVLLNSGVVLVGLGVHSASPELFVAGRLAQLLSAFTFSLHALPRIRPPGDPDKGTVTACLA